VKKRQEGQNDQATLGGYLLAVGVGIALGVALEISLSVLVWVFPWALLFSRAEKKG